MCYGTKVVGSNPAWAIFSKRLFCILTAFIVLEVRVVMGKMLMQEVVDGDGPKKINKPRGLPLF